MAVSVARLQMNNRSIYNTTYNPPPPGAIFINNSAAVDVSGCRFVDTSASSTFGGGAIYVESEEGSSIAASTTTQTALLISSSSPSALPDLDQTSLDPSLDHANTNQPRYERIIGGRSART